MTNLEMLALAARGLGALKDDAVFVGGATIELYLAGQAGFKIRPTDDVDCVVEVVSRVEYHKIEEQLRALGFSHPLDGEAPICRWQYKGIQVDVMPIEGKILGFTNRWYPDGFEKSIVTKLPDGQDIRIFALPYLIASKVEAFRDRGKGDYLGSTDLEDVVALLDGVPDFLEQIQGAPQTVRTYLQENFRELVQDERFVDSLEGHFPSDGRRERIAKALLVLQKL